MFAQTLKSELASTSEAVDRWRSEESGASEQHRAMNTLMRGLVETDHELAETERRAARRHRESGQHVRSSSHSAGVTKTYESYTHNVSHHSSSTHKSPPQHRDGVSERLTESFLTSHQHHDSQPQASQSSRLSGIPSGADRTRSGSSSRPTREGASGAHSGHHSVASYPLQTVGHNAGSGSLRVSKASTPVNGSFSSSGRAGNTNF